MAASPPPDANLVQQTLHMLNCGLSTDMALQTQALEALERNSTNPQFIEYLSLVFVGGVPGVAPVLQHIAGATLKASVERRFSALDEQRKARVKADVLRALVLPDAQVQRTASNIIATIVRECELSSWVELMPHLISMLDAAASAPTGGAALATSALNAICMLAEDAAPSFDDPDLGKPANALVPRLVQWMQYQGEAGASDGGAIALRLQCTAAEGMRLIFFDLPDAVKPHLATYLPALAALITGGSREGREVACRSLAVVIEQTPEYVWPQIDNIIRFQLQCLADPTEAIALHAAEFWPIICDSAVDIGIMPSTGAHASASLLPHMTTLVGLLMQRLVYSEEELANLGALTESATDVKPHIRRSRAPAGSSSGGGGEAVGGVSARTGSSAGDGGGLEEEEEEDEDNEEEDPNSYDPHGSMSWTLRARCGAALEFLASTYEEALLPHILPELKSRLDPASPLVAGPNGWLHREAAILALGAVRSGCVDALHTGGILAQVFPLLLACAGDALPLVRSMTLWTLSRYCEWALECQDMDSGRSIGAAAGGVAGAPSAGLPNPFTALLVVLCNGLSDPHVKVSVAAACALSHVLQNSDEGCTPHAVDIFRAILNALHPPHRPPPSRKLRLLLFDLIRTSAETPISAVLSLPTESVLADHLLTALAAAYAPLHDTDDELLKLLECLSALAPVMQSSFVKVAPSLYGRAVSLLEGDLTAILGAPHSGVAGAAFMAAHSYDTVATCIDVVNSIVESQGEGVADLMAPPSRLLELLQISLSLRDPAVTQSTFALVGELASAAWRVVEPHAGALMQHASLVLNSVTKNNISACNNASWAAGEMLLRMSPETVALVVPGLLPALVRALTCGLPNEMLDANTASAIGRLARVAPKELVSHPTVRIDAWLDTWLQKCLIVKDAVERNDAFEGLCSAIIAAPTAAAPHLTSICIVFASFTGSFQGTLREPLRGMMTTILTGFKGAVGPAAWAAVWAKLNAACQGVLSHTFGV